MTDRNMLRVAGRVRSVTWLQFNCNYN